MAWKDFYHRNKSRRKIEVREYKKRIRKAALDLMGGKCAKCGFSDYRALQIDHVSGDGYKDRLNTTKNYCNVVMESIKNKENKYQLLCANCNWIKKVENNEKRLVINK
jgi:hypothetical protein